MNKILLIFTVTLMFLTGCSHYNTLPSGEALMDTVENIENKPKEIIAATGNLGTQAEIKDTILKVVSPAQDLIDTSISPIKSAIIKSSSEVTDIFSNIKPIVTNNLTEAIEIKEIKTLQPILKISSDMSILSQDISERQNLADKLLSQDLTLAKQMIALGIDSQIGMEYGALYFAYRHYLQDKNPWHEQMAKILEPYKDFLPTEQQELFANLYDEYQDKLNFDWKEIDDILAQNITDILIDTAKIIPLKKLITETVPLAQTASSILAIP